MYVRRNTSSSNGAHITVPKSLPPASIALNPLIHSFPRFWLLRVCFSIPPFHRLQTTYDGSPVSTILPLIASRSQPTAPQSLDTSPSSTVSLPKAYVCWLAATELQRQETSEWTVPPLIRDSFSMAPPVIVFSSACAGLAGGAVPALAQLASSSYHAAISSSTLQPPSSQDEKINESRPSSTLKH
nr:hypothetical protein CQW23_00523 [Ipomoea trifida]